MPDYDVIVVGAGNAALAAANSAHQAGAKKVLVLEKANKKERGGNTFFSGGLLRIAFDDPRELEAMVPMARDVIPGFFEDVLPYSKSVTFNFAAIDLRRFGDSGWCIPGSWRKHALCW